jgi:uncharacterized protein (TIGR02145 family)
MVNCPSCGHEIEAYSKKKVLAIGITLIIAVFMAAFKYEDIKRIIKNWNAAILIDTRVDQEYKTYKTVKIGNKVWMAENLNFKVGYSACYANLDENCEKYGRLYDWVTALTACPKNWHLPSYAEWQALINNAGGKDLASKNLKTETSWEEGGNGIDKFGFAALPGGLGYSNAVFYSAGTSGNWWTSTEQNTNNAYYLNMFHQTNDISESDGNKLSLFSIRCVKD